MLLTISVAVPVLLIVMVALADDPTVVLPRELIPEIAMTAPEPVGAVGVCALLQAATVRELTMRSHVITRMAATAANGIPYVRRRQHAGPHP